MALGKKVRFEILKRDNFTCLYCGRNPPEVKLHVDHIIPKAQGGKDVPENLKTACQDCNLGKKDNPLGVAMIRARDLKAERKARREAKELQRLDEEREAEIYELAKYIHWFWQYVVPESKPADFLWLAKITTKSKIEKAIDITIAWGKRNKIKKKDALPYFLATCRNLSKEQNG